MSTSFKNTYCQSGAFVAADGSKYRLKVQQL